MSVFVVAEHRKGQLRPVTDELLAVAASLNAGPVTALLLAGPGEAAPLAAPLRGRAAAVLTVEAAELREGAGGAVASALELLVKKHAPRVLLGAASAAGMDWAPTLAARLGAPVVTDALDLAVAAGGATATRAAYGGKLLARVALADAPTLVATLRPGSFEGDLPAPAGEAPVTAEALEALDTLGRRFVGWVEEAAGDVDITQADVLVSVGRGIGDKENLDVAEALAKALGATLSCSRPVVDMNWLPKERQVGVSGKTVKPKVYIAVGISGAFQHVTAMKDAGVIIAVNKDAKAPIFRVAHYGGGPLRHRGGPLQGPPGADRRRQGGEGLGRGR